MADLIDSKSSSRMEWAGCNSTIYGLKREVSHVVAGEWVFPRPQVNKYRTTSRGLGQPLLN